MHTCQRCYRSGCLAHGFQCMDPCSEKSESLHFPRPWLLPSSPQTFHPSWLSRILPATTFSINQLSSWTSSVTSVCAGVATARREQLLPPPAEAQGQAREGGKRYHQWCRLRVGGRQPDAGAVELQTAFHLLVQTIPFLLLDVEGRLQVGLETRA